MSNVSIKNLAKSYGNVKAVDNVSAEIAEGEFFSLLGPSGCGKSTTLRMLAGFEEVTSGAIELDGQDVSGLPPEKRGIGFVFQNYAIFPHMNVFENIAFGLRLRGVPEDEIKTKVADALEQVGMTGLGARMQSEMSGGQQQRVALARVLVTEPRILLLDEPLSALDKNLREEMKFWIKDLQTKLGITTIYVTHDQGEALTMSDRIAVMKDGRIAQVGSPREIYQAPDNLFVAEFIGESSLVKTKVVSIDGPQCTLNIGSEKIAASHHDSLAVGDEANLVLRPEHVRIGEPGAKGSWNCLSARVVSVTYQGASLRFMLEIEGQTIISQIPNRSDAPDLSAGLQTPVFWSVESGYALPADSR